MCLFLLFEFFFQIWIYNSRSLGERRHSPRMARATILSGWQHFRLIVASFLEFSFRQTATAHLQLPRVSPIRRWQQQQQQQQQQESPIAERKTNLASLLSLLFGRNHIRSEDDVKNKIHANSDDTASPTPTTTITSAATTTMKTAITKTTPAESTINCQQKSHQQQRRRRQKTMIRTTTKISVMGHAVTLPFNNLWFSFILKPL